MSIQIASPGGNRPRGGIVRQGRHAERRRRDRGSRHRQRLPGGHRRRDHPQTEDRGLRHRGKEPRAGRFERQRHRRDRPHPQHGEHRTFRTALPGRRAFRRTHPQGRPAPLVLRQIRPVGPDERDGQPALFVQGHRNHRILAGRRNFGPPPRGISRRRGAERHPRHRRRGAQRPLPVQRERTLAADAMALQQHGKHLRADEPAGRRRQRIRRLAALDGQSRRDRRRRGPGRQVRPRRPGRQHVGQRGRTERHAGRRRRRQRLCG